MTTEAALKVRLEYTGYRDGCLACGQVIEKFQVRGFFGKGQSPDRVLCCGCLGRDFRPLMYEHGFALIIAGSDLQRLSARPLEDWTLPTAADIEAKQPEVDEGFRELAEEEGQPKVAALQVSSV